MPPWHVDKSVGIRKFKDDPSLTDDEVATIAAWMDAAHRVAIPPTSRE